MNPWRHGWSNGFHSVFAFGSLSWVPAVRLYWPWFCRVELRHSQSVVNPSFLRVAGTKRFACGPLPRRRYWIIRLPNRVLPMSRRLSTMPILFLVRLCPIWSSWWTYWRIFPSGEYIVIVMCENAFDIICCLLPACILNILFSSFSSRRQIGWQGSWSDIFGDGSHVLCQKDFPGYRRRSTNDHWRIWGSRDTRQSKRTIERSHPHGLPGQSGNYVRRLDQRRQWRTKDCWRGHRRGGNSHSDWVCGDRGCWNCPGAQTHWVERTHDFGSFLRRLSIQHPVRDQSCLIVGSRIEAAFPIEDLDTCLASISYRFSCKHGSSY